ENSIKPVFRSNELVSWVIAGCIELVGVRIATIASVLQIIDLSYLGLLLLCSIIFPGVVFLHAIDGEKGVAWEAELIRYCLDPQRLALFRVELIPVHVALWIELAGDLARHGDTLRVLCDVVRLLLDHHCRCFSVIDADGIGGAGSRQQTKLHAI